MTEYKRSFINAFDAIRPDSSDTEFVSGILERAKNMKSNDNVTQIKFTEITPEYVEPAKGRKIFGAVAGVAGAAAVLTGAVFGLKFLADNGGLKGPDVSGPGAGYSANADATAADANDNEFTTIFQSYSINGSGYVNVDQRYGVGDDITVHLKGYKFDGTWAKIYYDVIYKDEIMGGEIKQIAPKETENGHTESLEYTINANYAYCTANYRLDTPADSVNVSFGYKDDPQSDIFSLTMQKSTDMIDEPIVTTAVYMTTPPVEATTVTAVLPDSSDADTTTSYKAELQELNDMKAYYEYEFEAYETAKEATALEIAKFSQRKESLTAELARLKSLGEDTGAVEQELKSVEEDLKKQNIVLETYSTQSEETYDKLNMVKQKIAEIENSKSSDLGGNEAEVTSAIALDLPDEDTTTGEIGWEGVTSLGFKDKDINMTAFRYDGRFLEAILVGKEEDLYRVGVRSTTRARNIIHSTGRYDEKTGSVVFYALLDVPAGEFDNIEFIDHSTVGEVGYPVAGSSITIKGVDNYEPLMERVGVDMTEFGIPDAKLEWITLSPVGLEMTFTSKKKNALSSNILIERTSLNGTVVPFSGFYASTVYDDNTGLYHITMVAVPDDYNVDLTEMKEFSINGLKTKRAEFMQKSFWDLSSEPDMNEMQPVQTAVQMNIPE